VGLKILMGLLVLGIAGLFFIKGPSGEPFLSLDDLIPEVPVDKSSEPVTVYKWQDENGIWQFSNEPVQGKDVEAMELKGAVNVMPATPTSANRATTTAGSPAIPGVSEMAKATENIDALKSTIEERQAELDKIAPKP